MTSWSVTTFLAIALFAAFVTATVYAENDINSDDADFDVKVEKAMSDYLVKNPVARRKPRLLNIPNQIRPFCLKAVGKVQDAPKICDSVSGFVVDATTSACKESFREICRLSIGGSWGCEGIIKKICPSRAAVDKKIKKSVNKYCESSLQKVVDQFGRAASSVDKEKLCGGFIEGVRLTCHKTIMEYCEDVRDLFKYPCANFLPGIVCD